MAIVLRVKDDGSVVIEKFADNADKSAKKSSKAFDDFSSGAGISFRSVATYAGIAAAVIGATTVSMVKSAIESADAAVKAADKIGMTVEAYTALTYTAQLANVSQQELSQSLLMMVRNIANAAQGVGDAKYAIADLGLNAQALAKMKPEQALEAIAGALESIPNAGQRAAISAEIFNDRTGRMLNVLRGGPEALRKFYEEAQRAGKVLDDDAGRAAAEFNDNVTRLKANLEGTANTIMKSVLPSLLAMTDAMTGNESLPTLMIKQGRVMQMLAEAREQMEGMAAEPFGDVHDDISDLEAELERVNALIEEQRQRIADNLAGAIGGAGVVSGSREAEAQAKKNEDLRTELQTRLDSLVEANATETEIAQEKYFNDLILYQDFLTQKQVITAQDQLLLENLTAAHEKNLTTATANEAKKRAEAERQVSQTIMAMKFSVVQNAIGLLQALAGQNRIVAIAVIALQKGLAIAQTIMNTEVAAMMALAQLGPIAGLPAAATIRAMGAVSVGIIAATGLVEAANVGSGGASLGSFANPVYTANNAPLSSPILGSEQPLFSAPEPARPRPIYNFTFAGTQFTYQQITEDIIPLMNEAIANGAEINVRQV